MTQLSHSINSTTNIGPTDFGIKNKSCRACSARGGRFPVRLARFLKQVEKDSQILYFGESSNYSFGTKDTVMKRISELAAEYSQSINFQTVEHGTYHAGNYKILVENISKKSAVQTIIVSMNLRSFGAGWRFSNLETSLQKSMILMDPGFPPIINRIRLLFKNYDIKSDEERNRQTLHAWKTEKLVSPFPFNYNNVNDLDFATPH